MTSSSAQSDREMRAVEEPNQDPYRKRRKERKFKERPWSAYLFYFGPKPKKKGEVRCVDRYFYESHHGPIRRKDLSTLVAWLALNARRPDAEQNPRPYPKTVLNVWKRKSYLIVLVDDPNFKFERNAFMIVPNEANEPKKHANHTFFDAKNFNNIKLPNSNDRVSAVCVLDHMKRYDEDDLMDEYEEFDFRLNPDPRGRRLDDDGGKNLGPPVPPP